jgi:hypothetical protein
MALIKYKMQLQDQRTGEIIQKAGGAIMVCGNGSPTKVTTYNADGTAKTNPVALNNGSLEFYVQDTVASVDIAGFTPDGQFVTLTGLRGSGPSEINVDRGNRHQVAMVPFSWADGGVNVEKDTGLDLPANALVLPDVGILTKDIDAGITINAGILSTESGGSASGFVAAISVAAAVLVAAKSAATATRGSLVGGATLDRGYTVVAASQSISYTLLAGADTATGWIVLPYILPLVA